MNFTGRLSIICARTFVGSEKERQEDAILKACTGLEGGIVAAGSTCGVVTAGVLGLACDAAPDLLQGDTAAEKAVMERAARYVRWFEDTYGSSFCRARTGVNFYSTAGQLRYLVPGDLGKAFIKTSLLKHAAKKTCQPNKQIYKRIIFTRQTHDYNRGNVVDADAAGKPKNRIFNAHMSHLNK